MVIGNYMEKRCKIININTGKEREVVTVPCKICDRFFDPEEEGICGVIGNIPVLFLHYMYDRNCRYGRVFKSIIQRTKENKKQKGER